MAQTFLSPGVNVTEIDNTLTAKTVGISTGAAVLVAGWGPVLQPTLIDSENTLVNVFGQPNDNNYKQWFTAANFLAYTDSMYVTRLATKNQFNANSKGKTGWQTETFTNESHQQVAVVDEDGDPIETRVGVTINNETDYTAQYDEGNGDFGEFVAKYPGALGNSIMVTYADAGSFSKWQWTDANGNYHDWTQEFAGAPGTSNYARARDGSNDEIHLLVVDAGGRITGTKGAILEKYQYLSKASNSKSVDGISNNYAKILKEQSEYVYWMDYPTNKDSDDQILQHGNIVPPYDKAVAAITTSEDQRDQLIEDQLVDAGEFVVDTTEQVIYKAEIGYTFVEDGDHYRRQTVITLKPTNIELASWVGLSVFDRQQSKVLKVVKNSDNGTIQLVTNGVEEGADWGQSVVNNHFKVMINPYSCQLSGGSDDWEYSDADEIAGWDLVANKEQFDIGLIPMGPATATVAKYVVQNICETRMDCVAFISPNEGRGPILGNLSNEDKLQGITSSEIKILDKTLKWRTDSSFNLSSSYAHLDSGWKYQYDKYNDCNRWIPLNGDCAGIYARTDRTNDPWWSGAGYNRGQVKNVIKLSYSPNKAHRDQLYPQGINPVVTFTGEGTILYGDKTLLAKPSAFDRINVRRLFIYIEKVLSETAKYLLFEFNDATTRSYAVSIFEPVLRTIYGARGIEAYKIVIDSSNNTADVLNANRLVADVYVIPTKSINFISINMICEKSGSSVFSETENTNT